MTLNRMVVGQCVLFPLPYLPLSLCSILNSSDSHTCSPVGPCRQLEDKHLAFLWRNKAVVSICQSPDMDSARILRLGGVRVRAV